MRKLTLSLTVIAIIFHLVGITGIGLLHNTGILSATPYHLLLMFTLLVISFMPQRGQAFKWLLLTYIIGFGVEWIGVHTAFLFGSYRYNNGLGLQCVTVPLLIGCLWCIVLSGAVSIAALITRNRYIMAFAAAGIATAYDWLIEPVAVRLHYWQWQVADIPAKNYISWWLVSFIIALFWNYFKVQRNQFAINLFLIQAVFFILLRLL